MRRVPASGKNRSLDNLPHRAPDCCYGAEPDRKRIWWNLTVSLTVSWLSDFIDPHTDETQQLEMCYDLTTYCIKEVDVVLKPVGDTTV